MLLRGFIFFLLACIGTAQADELDYSVFARIPIQHEGRIKPLGTFALVHLEHFYGKSHIGDMSANAWLAQTMFDPGVAMERPVFLMKDADAQAMLGLPDKDDHLYSYIEVSRAVAVNQKLIQSLIQQTSGELSAAQRAVVDMYEDDELFTQILLSSTLFLRLTVAVPDEDLQRLGIDKNLPPTFVDYYKYMPYLQKSVKELVARKGTNPDKYTPSETSLAQVMSTLAITMDSTQNNILLRIIPPQWNSGDAWLSPWAVFHFGQGSPQTAEFMQGWRDLVNAYHAQDAKRWREASEAFAKKTADTPGVRTSALALENSYYAWWPLGIATVLYMLALVLTLLCLAGLPLRTFALVSTLAGACLHLLSIAARIYILERPPVGTLYESLLFVSLIAVGFGMFIEYRMRNYLGLLVAAIAGSGLLLASQSFSGDDTMSMLIAVLNTNFWLATHVLCVTSGYGFGLVAGIIAHVYLIMRCLHRPDESTRRVLRSAYATSLIALLCTSLGTILGGIWADQSWGRFWGWDPKENGALVICLWLIWIIHGTVSGHVRERGFAVGLVLLNVVIAASWLGVNLLATGLHSYGFTDKSAWSFAGFCIGECGFAASCYFILWRRERAAAPR